MKIAITGSNGLFGYGIAEVFREDCEVFPLTRRDFDLTDHPRMRDVLCALRPDVIVHPAGIPDIDLAELQPALAWAVNTEGTKAIVEAARQISAGLAFISTDAVFDGLKEQPYVEGDVTTPPSVYGRTKLAAEQAVATLPKHWIFRVSVLFGPGKTNFIANAIEAVAAGKEHPVAIDQVGSATYTPDAARVMKNLIKKEKFGLYHISNAGPCSRYDLAVRAVEFAGLDSAKVIGRPMADMKRPGPRLKYSVMALENLQHQGFPPLRLWQDALKEYVASLQR